MRELDHILQRLGASLGPLRGQPRVLEGGITNLNFRVTLGETDYVIRLPGKDTDLLGIDRESEQLANRWAAGLGIAPAVAAALGECLITSFVSCETVDSSEIAERAGEIARGLRSFHDSCPPLRARFWVPELLERYAAIVRARGGALSGGYLQAISAATRIEGALPLRRARPCHNDLLAKNIIRAQDDARLLLVDWEYAGMGDPRFDLGNIAVNNDFDEAAEERLLIAYYDEAPTDGHRAALKLMRILSDAREGAWGVVQRQLSELDFDFIRYGEEHFERLRSSLEQEPFAEWLAAAAQLDEREQRAQGA